MPYLSQIYLVLNFFSSDSNELVLCSTCTEIHSISCWWFLKKMMCRDRRLRSVCVCVCDSNLHMEQQHKLYSVCVNGQKNERSEHLGFLLLHITCAIVCFTLSFLNILVWRFWMWNALVAFKVPKEEDLQWSSTQRLSETLLNSSNS